MLQFFHVTPDGQKSELIFRYTDLQKKGRVKISISLHSMLNVFVMAPYMRIRRKSKKNRRKSIPSGGRNSPKSDDDPAGSLLTEKNGFQFVVSPGSVL